MFDMMDISFFSRLNLRSLKSALSRDSIFNNLISRYAYSRDAGFYRMLPSLVIKAQTIDDVSAVFQYASRSKRSVVFRAGGTSLSGQAVSDDILVEVRKGWRDLEVLEGGQYIKLEPGVVATRANKYLEPHGYRIGPDPGSIRSALMGGIVANNASGIGSGIHANSYQTLAGMKIVLTSGLILDTADPDARTQLRSQAPHIHDGLIGLRDKIRASKDLSSRIAHKYKLKNTMGYSLNSFLDHDDPLEILAHLMVGSEGTLGFIAGVTLKTVPLCQHKSTAFILLSSILDAAKLVPKLKRAGTSALEIMDESALRAVQHLPGLPIDKHMVIGPDSAALLIEFEDNDPSRLNAKVAAAIQILKENHPNMNPQFFSDPQQRDKLWKIRRELGPHHAATRRAGTTVLSEDVCFKVKDLAKAIKDLQELFRAHGYEDAVIFGHAGDGNLHFKLSLDLDEPRELATYSSFIGRLVDLVLDKYDGSLKAEHGTGRNMAPFLKREWGGEAYGIMREIKALLDPNSILNPDVLLSSDDQIHLKHIKPIPQVDEIIDPCIECGLCEPVCPSEDFTLTPRQRIVVLREMETASNEGRSRLLNRLGKAYRFQGVSSCAADSLCALSCPVGIDTGKMMKKMRSQRHGALSRMISKSTQRHFAVTSATARVGLRVLTPLRVALKNQALGSWLTRLNKITRGVLPVFSQHLKAASGVLPLPTKVVDVIYYPSCLTRMLIDPGSDGLATSDTFTKILKAADLGFEYPQKVTDLCCGLSYSSKGYSEAGLNAAIQTTEMLWLSSREGRIPIVMDASPCSKHMQEYEQILSGVHLARWRALKIYDMVEYLHDVVLDRSSFWHVKEKVALHISCSTQHMGLEGKLKTIASRCAKEVVVPIDSGCCGFAGDRGLLVPGLTSSATLMESQELSSINAEGYYSTSRTCEIGMSQATGKTYESILSLVYEAMIKRSA